MFPHPLKYGGGGVLDLVVVEGDMEEDKEDVRAFWLKPNHHCHGSLCRFHAQVLDNLENVDIVAHIRGYHFHGAVFRFITVQCS